MHRTNSVVKGFTYIRNWLQRVETINTKEHHQQAFKRYLMIGIMRRFMRQVEMGLKCCHAFQDNIRTGEDVQHCGVPTNKHLIDETTINNAKTITRKLNGLSHTEIESARSVEIRLKVSEASSEMSYAVAKGSLMHLYN